MGGIISRKAYPADAKTGGEEWKSYLTAEEQEAVLKEARLIREGQELECHQKRIGSAIFWASTSRYDLRCKLAELLVALEDGADPNEEEFRPMIQMRSGRPLDLCLNDSKADMGGESLLNNIPVIQLLLDYGADPRLDPIPQIKGGLAVPLEPVQQARKLAEAEKGPIKTYYQAAYRILKKASDRLDRLDRLDGTPGCEKADRPT